MSLFGRHKSQLPKAEDALSGRDERMRVPPAHFVNGHPLCAPAVPATPRWSWSCSIRR
jgi:hypothetical protein